MPARTAPRRSIRFEAAPPTRPRQPDGVRRTTFDGLVVGTEARDAEDVDALAAGAFAAAGRAVERPAAGRPAPPRPAAGVRAPDPRRGGRDAGPVLRLEAIGCSPGSLPVSRVRR
ncbi:hypothetical protein [Phycicoccus sp.]|uniref:hypothetical protein n=1 Tax=Phycicoccus sp. TaxID=1902410 RepID=UPI002D038A8C|nr:hypothetical protein [Phycicoccus sp.]HMM93463.1 hypothetical protein [Phycicoccus sp.]